MRARFVLLVLFCLTALSPGVVATAATPNAWLRFRGPGTAKAELLKRHLVCVNRADGEIRWSKSFDAELNVSKHTQSMKEA